MPRNTHSFTQRLVALILEPQFIQFENVLREPNIFKIVGRAHYERWHSCFWGWLLDPSGSHLLGGYVLRRLLLLLYDERALGARPSSADALLPILPTAGFHDVEVTPNENASAERSITGIGRLDIFVSANVPYPSGTDRRLNIVLELKIDSKYSVLQVQ